MWQREVNLRNKGLMPYIFENDREVNDRKFLLCVYEFERVVYAVNFVLTEPVYH